MDLNLCRQIKDKWGFRVSKPCFIDIQKCDPSAFILNLQMTQRLELYRDSLGLYLEENRPEWQDRADK